MVETDSRDGGHQLDGSGHCRSAVGKSSVTLPQLGLAVVRSIDGDPPRYPSVWFWQSVMCGGSGQGFLSNRMESP
jgi:hypothetical protein